MELKEIQEFIRQVGEFSSLTIEKEGFRFELKREAPKVVEAYAAAAVQPAPIAPEDGPESGAPAIDPNARVIESPLVGLFHELPGDQKVSIGDKLKAGQTVCQIEAMKLMNDVTIPEDGEIVWIAATEGDSVEYGQALYHYI